METKESLKNTIKSILIVRFISDYSEMENLIISKFQEEIKNASPEKKNKLFFYYGIAVGHSVYYDFDQNKVKLAESFGYNEDETFKSLNLNRIIKFDEKERLIDSFNFKIDSLIRKSMEFEFHTCCKQLMSMRNKLAHVMYKLSFNDKDIVENLSMDYILKQDFDYLQDFDIRNMEEDSVALLSNIVYTKEIMKHLKC